MNKIKFTVNQNFLGLIDPISRTTGWLEKKIGPRKNPANIWFDTMKVTDTLTGEDLTNDDMAQYGSLHKLTVMRESVLEKCWTSYGYGWILEEIVRMSGDNSGSSRYCVVHIEDDCLAVECKLIAPWQDNWQDN
jgi:hypothetical protein